MMGGYWYVEGADGVHYCWAKVPTFRCPFGEGPPVALTDALDSEAENGWPTSDKLVRMFQRAHGTGMGGRERDEQDRLTDRCRGCGAQLERLGYRAWAEREKPPGEHGEGVVAEALGFGRVQPIGDARYFRTKKQAAAWARKQAGKSPG